MRTILSTAPASLSTDSLDHEPNPFPILSRPTLLPTPVRDVTDILKTEIDLVGGTKSTNTAGSAANAASVGTGGAGFGGNVYGGVGSAGGTSSTVHGHVRPSTHPTHNTHDSHTTHTAHTTQPPHTAQHSTHASGHGSEGSGSEAVTRENSDHFDVNLNFPRPQSPGRLGSPSFSGKHINTTSTLSTTSGAGGGVIASPSRGSFGLGSFSTSPSAKSGGSRKHEDVVAEQTADIVQAAIDAAHLLTDPDSSKTPFEVRFENSGNAWELFFGLKYAFFLNVSLCALPRLYYVARLHCFMTQCVFTLFSLFL